MPWSDEVPESCRMDAKAAQRIAETVEEPIVDIDPETVPKGR